MKSFWIFASLVLTTIVTINAYGLYIEYKSVNVTTSKNEESKLEKEKEDRIIIDNKWILDFHDDFSYLDLKKWNIEPNNKSFNNELQYYKFENLQAKNGHLYIYGLKESYRGREYTSGKISTKGMYSFKYGRVEIRLKTNEQNGSFPAVWMLPANGGKMPEIDIYEAVGKEKGYAYHVNHWKEKGESKRSFSKTKLNNSSDFHTYAIEWTKDKIQWFVDGKLIHTSTEGIPNEEMYLIINLAIGGNWPGNPDENTKFPMELVIDDLKIMKEM